MNTVYYTQLNYKRWSFYLAATDDGLCFVGSSPASKTELTGWVDANFPQNELIKDEAYLKPYTVAFVQYLSKQTKTLNVDTHLIGSSFQKKVWNSLLTIPYGKTTSYSDLAVKIGRKPTAARAIGTAIGKNPLLIVYPCHRVVPKSSKPKGFRGGLDMKKRLLELEQ